MKVFILLLYLTSYDMYPGTLQAEFYSKDKCEAAGQAATYKFDEQPYKAYVHYVCVEK